MHFVDGNKKLFKSRIRGLGASEQEIFDLGFRLVKTYGQVSRVAKRKAAREAISHLELIRERGRPMPLDLSRFSNSLEYHSGEISLFLDSWSSFRPDFPACRRFSSLKIKYEKELVFDALLEELGPNGTCGYIKKFASNKPIYRILKEVQERCRKDYKKREQEREKRVINFLKMITAKTKR